MPRSLGTTPAEASPAILAMALILAAVGCSSTAPDAAATAKVQATEEATVRQLDAYWLKTAAAKDVNAWLAYYADDAAVLPPNEPVATSKADIRKSVAGLLSLPSLSLTWRPTKVEASKSGDLAYLYGTYSMTASDDKGNPISDTGKIVEIWKKQADGKWKCIVDTWNSDIPLTPPATASK